jgi:membrane fusion protein (multidrug efflux system)
MSRKQIIAGIVVVVGGLGIYALVTKLHSSSPDEAESTPAPLVTVQTGQLKRATLHGYVEGFGTVTPAPAGEGLAAASARVASPVAGVIAETEVAEGQHVEKDALLFTLDTRTAQVAVERGRQAVQFATQAVERQETLFKSQNTSAKNLQDAQAQLAGAKADLAAAEMQLALLHIRAPLSGTVTHVYVRPGEAVDLNTPVADLVDMNRLVIAAGIPSFQTSKLKVGEPVELLADDNGGTKESGTNESIPSLSTNRISTPPTSAAAGSSQAVVSFVSPTVDESNATVMVRISLPAGGPLRPGQFVRFRILAAEHVDTLAAPAESVVPGTNGEPVIALVTDSQATLTAVQTGLREEGWVEVQAPGLHAGEDVVTVGAYGLPDKAKVRVVNPEKANSSVP